MSDLLQGGAGGPGGWSESDLCFGGKLLNFMDLLVCSHHCLQKATLVRHLDSYFLLQDERILKLSF